MNNSLGMGGKVIQPTGANTWVMHLNDAAHYTISTSEANNILIQLRLSVTTSPVQIGGGTCSNATFNGTFFYFLNGTVTSGGQSVPYAEFGKFVVDGMGHFSGGPDSASTNGQQTIFSANGTYTVQPNCSGSVSTSQLTFQLVNNGQGLVVAVSTPEVVVNGLAYRTTAGATPVTCGTGSLSGGYGYVLTGFAGGVPYSDAGQFVADGNGNGSTASTANLGGSVSTSTGSGTYTVASDCSGTASVTNQNGTANYRFAIIRDGQAALFFETDSGRTVSGVFTPIFAPPQQAIVNGASFQGMAAPGSLFSIFGTGLSAQSASASTLPLPRSLSGTQVLVNGESAPLVYVSDKQINAQMPIDVPTGQPVSVTVTNAGSKSNTATVTIPPAAPGIFTYNGNLAVVQNPNGSVNSPTDPAHPGDVLVAYLTGGGAVNAAGPWLTGAASPGGLSGVTAQYSVSVDGQPAEVEYLGLTPGLVGLYQTNFKVPSLAPGSYPVVVTLGGVSSNAAMVAVGS